MSYINLYFHFSSFVMNDVSSFGLRQMLTIKLRNYYFNMRVLHAALNLTSSRYGTDRETQVIRNASPVQ